MNQPSLRYSDDSSSVKYGDIVYIYTVDKKFVTVEEDGETISFRNFENDGLKQKLLVCGNSRLNNSFYLTFKNSKGFLCYDEQVLKSGAPWTEKSVFTEELLKQSLRQQVLQIQRATVDEADS